MGEGLSLATPGVIAYGLTLMGQGLSLATPGVIAY